MTTVRRAAMYLLVAATAGCSGRDADRTSGRDGSHVAARRGEAQHLAPRRDGDDIETGAITGATNAAPCPSSRGSPDRKCFAVARGPFVLTDLEAFAYAWFPTQTQGWQEAVAFPGPSDVSGVPPAVAPRWQTQASEYWGSGWTTGGGEDWNSGLPRMHRYLRAVHNARYFVAPGEVLYISVSYRGCWKGTTFERDTCSPGSSAEISATFSGYRPESMTGDVR